MMLLWSVVMREFSYLSSAASSVIAGIAASILHYGWSDCLWLKSSSGLSTVDVRDGHTTFCLVRSSDPLLSSWQLSHVEEKPTTSFNLSLSSEAGLGSHLAHHHHSSHLAEGEPQSSHFLASTDDFQAELLSNLRNIITSSLVDDLMSWNIKVFWSYKLQSKVRSHGRQIKCLLDVEHAVYLPPDLAFLQKAEPVCILTDAILF